MLFRRKAATASAPGSNASTVEYHYRDPHRASRDYQAWLRLRSQLQSELRDLQQHRRGQGMSIQPTNHPLTKQRLAAVSSALEHNLALAEQLLAPIATGKKAKLEANHPGLQWNFLRYLIRDWGPWGHAEIAQMMEALRPALERMQADQQGGVMVAPGAGAMRLPMEVAAACGAKQLIGIEMDALLCHGAAQLLNGKPLTLYEVPIEPIDLRHCAIERQLSIPSNTLQSVQTKLWAGDANECIDELHPDILFTQFVLDVAGGDVLCRSQHWVQRLKPGAWWVNIGPISLRQPHACDNYSRDEIQATMEQAGLRFEYQQEVQIPHLNSPANQRHQIYSCWVFAGVKR